MHQAGSEDLEECHGRMVKLLLSKQAPDGSWSTRDLDNNSAGFVYQTSIAVIILSVPTHYLPIFQR